MRFIPLIGTVAGLALLGVAATKQSTESATRETAAVISPFYTVGVSDLDRILRPGIKAPLPKTFRGLVNYVEKMTAGSSQHTFIPHGRSLVRAQTDYKDPRLVVMTYTAEPGRIGKDGVDTHGHGIFLAFSKKAELVEAISYNETAGRYEFEVIEHFGSKDAKLKPQVLQADRGVCLACHKIGTPIFPTGTWQETADHNPGLYDKLMEAQEGRRTYEGFALPESQPDPGQFTSPGDDFERAANDASKRLATNDVWRTLCRKDPGCRVDLVRFSFWNLAELHRELKEPLKWPTYVQAWAARKKLFSERYPQGVAILSPTISPRDSLKYPDIDRYFDPVLAEFGVKSRYKDDFGVNELVGSFVETVFDADDAQRFKAYLQKKRGNRSLNDTFVEETKGWLKQSWAVDDEAPLRRCDVLQAIMPGQAHPGCGPVSDSWRAPTPPAIAVNDPQLAPFQKYCASCHVQGHVQPAFLSGSRETFLDWAHCVSQVLTWQGNPGRTMPPDISPLRDQLKNDVETFNRMRIFASRGAEERQLATRTRLKAAPPSCLR